MITTASEAIKILEQLDPEADLLITWWSEEDFVGKELNSAYAEGERQLENCIGHVNEWVEDEAEEI